MFEPILKQLACPGQRNPCGGQLNLRSDHSVPGGNHLGCEDVISGLLCCEACGQSYPIIAGIAVILPDWSDYILARCRHISALPAAALPVEAVQLLTDPNARHRRIAQVDNWEATDVLNGYLLSHFLFHALDGPGDLDSIFSSKRIAAQVRQDWPQTPLFLLKSWLTGDLLSGGVLELGCSVGGTVPLLAELLSGPYLGLDMSIRSVAMARRLILGTADAARGLLPEQFALSAKDGLDNATRSRLRGLAVDFVVADALRPPVAKHDWDVVSAMNMVDFSPDPVSFVQMQADLLRLGGRCFTTAPLSPHSPAYKALSDWSSGSASSPADVLTGAYRQAGLALSQWQVDLPWIVPRGPRYVEYFSVDAFLLERLSSPEADIPKETGEWCNDNNTGQVSS
ncbi:methyltransferase domain-containing protein [Parasedimentitalea maritima]|uniref:Methyltransferase domain-containing protein n=1 Tax=Parasedimentitalea maritima TaxID=2578117 RepID=A0A6A4R9L4_9RHOB|nr:methyltransferase domain-containing protein [Zongyanglinia marina]KAE9624748.1 methyltransferase domain-containing protein [Zongyanglinia marina]